LKQSVRLLLGHADAGILDGEAELDLVAGPLKQLADEADLTSLRELHRVAKQVDEHLSQSQRVAARPTMINIRSLVPGLILHLED